MFWSGFLNFTGAKVKWHYTKTKTIALIHKKFFCFFNYIFMFLYQNNGFIFLSCQSIYIYKLKQDLQVFYHFSFHPDNWIMSYYTCIILYKWKREIILSLWFNFMLTTYWLLAINIVIYISANKVYVMYV